MAGELVVQTRDGKLRGVSKKNLDDEDILLFLGIPYAKPPVGDLRFKEAVPADSWDGVQDASEDAKCCYQRQANRPLEGSEDCLYLNVYTKSVSSDIPRPVMVFIHGGAFTTGSNKSTIFGPDYLLTEDIVLVSINYRLGIFGFLQRDDPTLDITENNGLKDQRLALNWVQKNIKYFGGDPDNVTIFGESAGSASVHFHVLSPLSKGLFHKALMQSGVATNPWALGRCNVLEIVNVIGVNVNTEREALEYLRNLTGEELFEAQSKYLEVKTFGKSFGPVIEKPGPGAFLTQTPLDVIISGDYNHVPLIMGYNDREGILIAQSGKHSLQFDRFSRYFASSFGLEEESETNQTVCKRLWSHYFPQGEDELATVLFAGDFFFVVGKLLSIKHHKATTPEPIYFYRMSLDAGLNIFKKKLGATHIKGACHVDDIFYLFPNATSTPPAKGSLEYTSVRRFVKLWTNFAKFGNPTPPGNDLGVAWDPVGDDCVNFLDIGDELRIDANPDHDRMTVWNEVIDIIESAKTKD